MAVPVHSPLDSPLPRLSQSSSVISFLSVPTPGLDQSQMLYPCQACMSMPAEDCISAGLVSTTAPRKTISTPDNSPIADLAGLAIPRQRPKRHDRGSHVRPLVLYLSDGWPPSTTTRALHELLEAPTQANCIGSRSCGSSRPVIITM